MNFDQNNDPPHIVQDNPRALPEPIVNTAVRTTQHVRGLDSVLVLCSNGVLIANGQSRSFSRASDSDNDNDNDNDVEDDDIDSSSDVSSEDQREIDDVGVRPRQNEDSAPLVAYLICEVIRDAIYGAVHHGIVLRRSSPNDAWRMTNEHCAIKVMPWEGIRNRRQGSQENPRDEVAAMQYFKQFYDGIMGGPVSASTAMLDTKIIMPLDFLCDERDLYTITPFCEGGDLLDSLIDRTRFTEGETRNLLTDILDGLEWLQRVGFCHRDISAENIMIYQGRAIIIDMGMCLKIPYLNDAGRANEDHQDRFAQRCLIRALPRAGKGRYMSPEIFNEQPFDGHAVDMWCVGACLYAMLTGRHLWTRPSDLDRHFRHISRGYLVPILRDEFNDGLTPDAIDLLQRMLLLDPTDRLSLQQVRLHPWMIGQQNQVAPGLD